MLSCLSFWKQNQFFCNFSSIVHVYALSYFLPFMLFRLFTYVCSNIFKNWSFVHLCGRVLVILLFKKYILYNFLALTIWNFAKTFSVYSTLCSKRTPNEFWWVCILHGCNDFLQHFSYATSICSVSCKYSLSYNAVEFRYCEDKCRQIVSEGDRVRVRDRQADRGKRRHYNQNKVLL